MTSHTLDGMPVDIPQPNFTVLPFDPCLLPDTLRDWVNDIADRIQCPPDFPAVSAMIALSAVVGRRVGICPQQRADWLVVPNLWGCVVGRPGIMKTPAIAEPLRALKRLEIDAKIGFDLQQREYLANLLVQDAKRKEVQSAIRAAVKDAPEQAAELARLAVADELPEPTRTRYLVNDSSVEMLGVLLRQNPLGHLLLFRDELVGLLVGLDKQGQEQARTFYLEAWNGDGRFTFDRIGRGTVDIEAACISLLGGIQPGPLQKYLTGNARTGGDDGLVQRLQLMVWPEVNRDWKNVDRWPDTPARDRAHDVYFRLANTTGADLGATVVDDRIPHLRFDGEAQEQFNEWRERLEAKVRSGEEHPAIESHLAKYRSLVPSLALLDHIAGNRTGPVGAGSVGRAISWAIYLESHARRVYGAAADDRYAPARELARRIRKGQVKSTFAARDIYRNGWTGLTDATAVEQAAEVLVEFDWLRVERKQTAGRTATLFHLHPSLTNGP